MHTPALHFLCVPSLKNVDKNVSAALSEFTARKDTETGPTTDHMQQKEETADHKKQEEEQKDVVRAYRQAQAQNIIAA